MACIYKIINNINKKFYIGKTKRNSIIRRWKEHQRMAGDVNYRHPLYDGIRHHGIENFSIEILEECELFHIDEKEKFWINKLTPAYNLTVGGDGGDTFSKKPEYMKEITRKKLSNHAKKMWSNPAYREKQSELAKDRWNDQGYREKQSELAKDRWENQTYREHITKKARENAQKPEYLAKISAAVKESIKNKKDIWSDCKKGKKNGRWLGYIEMYNPAGELCKIYESAVECHLETGIAKHVIRNKARTGTPILVGDYKGYIFKFNKEPRWAIDAHYRR
jgi:group I intron endonuclease